MKDIPLLDQDLETNLWLRLSQFHQKNWTSKLKIYRSVYRFLGTIFPNLSGYLRLALVLMSRLPLELL
jgi:hypothetical protein